MAGSGTTLSHCNAPSARYRRILVSYCKSRTHCPLGEYRPDKGGLGKFVEIRHSNGWVTGYGHLSRFAAGIFPGKKIQQKDLVGYVGTTGWTTGPHLHYQVEIGGRHVNPLKLQAPAGSPVKSDCMTDFQQIRQKFLSDLNSVTAVLANTQY